MGTWLNSDSLYIKYGTTRATPTIAGAYATPASGGQTVVEFVIDLTTLGTSAAILSDVIVLPKYAFIDKVELVPIETVTSAGSSAVLNVGLLRTDRSTAYDDDGIIDAEAQADFNVVGEIVTYTQPGVGDSGDLVGTQLANNALVTADYDTEAFTDGTVVVRIFYHMGANRS